MRSARVTQNRVMTPMPGTKVIMAMGTDGGGNTAPGPTQALAEFGAKVLAATFTDESGLPEAVEAYGALLSTALYRIGRGTAVIPKPASQLVNRRPGEGILSRLSPRERDVLALMAEG